LSGGFGAFNLHTPGSQKDDVTNGEQLPFMLSCIDWIVRSRTAAGKLVIVIIAPFAKNSLFFLQNLMEHYIANNGGHPIWEKLHVAQRGWDLFEEVGK